MENYQKQIKKFEEKGKLRKKKIIISFKLRYFRRANVEFFLQERDDLRTISFLRLRGLWKKLLRVLAIILDFMNLSNYRYDNKSLFVLTCFGIN